MVSYITTIIFLYIIFIKGYKLLNINRETKKLFNILKQYGNVNQVANNKLEFKSGWYKRIIWLDEITVKGCSIRLAARLSSVYYCLDKNTENVLKGETATDVEIARIQNDRIYRVHGLLNLAIEIIAHIDHLKIYNTKRLR